MVDLPAGSPRPPAEDRTRIRLSVDPTSAGVARAFAGHALAAWPPGIPAADAVLVVSELVTNAVSHALGPVTLTLTLCEHHLRIAVGDHDVARGPVVQRPDADATGGRGLALVERLTDRWGVRYRRERGTKTVWCELPRSWVGDQWAAHVTESPATGLPRGR
jgi:anti-sigma regulatory factor (Ser/Thr protein kinase)